MPKHSDLGHIPPQHCYHASIEKSICAGKESWFPGLRRLRELGVYYSRNSYRYRISHIYETVKLNQIEQMFNYSESEIRFKAFIEHGLD